MAAFDDTPPVPIKSQAEIVKVKKGVFIVSLEGGITTLSKMAVGNAFEVGDLVLISAAIATAGNGVYKITGDGDDYTIERDASANTAEKILGLVVQDESTGKRYQMITAGEITLEATELEFAEVKATAISASATAFSDTPPVAIAQT